MIHKKERFDSGILQFILYISVIACLFSIQSCGQSRNVAHQSSKEIRNDSLSGVPVLVPDMMPIFPGGEDGMIVYISSNLRYPKTAQDQKIEGRVSLRFVIDTDGWVKKIEVVRSVNPALDEAAIQAVRDMPKWKPGKKNGVNVPVYYTIPILFKLNRP